MRKLNKPTSAPIQDRLGADNESKEIARSRNNTRSVDLFSHGYQLRFFE